MIEELQPTALTDGQRAAWHDLCLRAAEPNPFFDPAVVIPAATHLPGGDGVRLVVVRDGDRWLAALPVVPDRSWHRIPLPGTVAWKHPYSFLGTPLLDGDDLERAARALLKLPRRWPRRAFLALETVRSDGPVAAALRAAAPRGTLLELHAAERAALLRRPEDDYVDGNRSGKRRREAKRLRKRLAQDLGDEPVLCDRGTDPDAVERFLALEASGWKGRAETALANDAGHAAFFRAVCAGPHESLEAELLELGTPDRAAAMLFNLVAGDTAFSLKLAHDETLAAGAPGVQLMTDAVGWFHDRTPAEHLDSCASPDNPMINALWPDRRATTSFVITATGVGGMLGRSAVRAYASAQRRRTLSEPRVDRAA